MDRIIIIGLMATGKTTLAGKLSQQLQIPYYERDQIRFGPNWTRMPDDAFDAEIEAIAARERWVLDSGRRRHITWVRADTLIWLNYPFWFVLWRVTTRTMRRVFWREKRWGRNEERWSTLYTNYPYVLRRYLESLKRFPAEFSKPEFQHLNVIRLRSQQETDAWLAGITGKKQELG
jgi:adenylate kinase family enzyme